MIIIEKNLKFDQFFTKSEQKRAINMLVLHHIEANSALHAIEQFKQHQVSSHFLIDENGKIYELVDENDIAYHAGYSYWNGFNGLNAVSIGIEFINKDPFKQKFTDVQMLAGVELCQYLIKKYDIKSNNIVGHSDIAYDPQNGLLDRKQDPSHFFDWQYLAKNWVGFYPKIDLLEDEILYFLGDSDQKLLEIKQKLAKIGYKVTKSNNAFDIEMQLLVRVFNRRYNPQKFNIDADCWYLSSQMVLDQLLQQLI